MQSDDGYKEFLQIREEYGDKLDELNEADTRCKIIDRILIKVLGWNEKNIKREINSETGYADYHISIDDSLFFILEAKKSGQTFIIPEDYSNRYYKINGSIKSEKNLQAAIQQVRNYCDDWGCKYAIVSNGFQFISFTAVTIGKPWKEGNCLIFKSFDDIFNNFNLFWNIFSFNNVKNGSLTTNLEHRQKRRKYYKVLEEIRQANNFNIRNELYTFLRPISQLIFSELIDEAQAEVLKSCYVFGKSNNPLSQEIESYYEDKLPHHLKELQIKDITESANKAGKFQDTLNLELKTSDGNLIVLLGGIGSGKSTFLHRFFKIVLSKQEDLLYFYLDFRLAPVSSDEIESFILEKIYEIWKSRYEDGFREKFEECGYSISEKENKYELNKLFNFIKGLGFNITIVVDNVDQHDKKFQEKLFMESYSLTYFFKVLTLVALREETFLISSISGVFDAYNTPKFHISSPNFLNLIKKRISFTLELLESDKSDLLFKKITIYDKKRLIQYFHVIDDSLKKENDQSKKIVKFIDSITVGNMREGLEMFNSFLVSGNTNVKEIFSKLRFQKTYQISYHQFVKSILLGEHEFYEQDKSKIFNIYDFDSTISSSPFHLLRILNYLENNNNKKSLIGRGYNQIRDLIIEAEKVFINEDIIIDALQRLSNYNLIEYDTQSRLSIKNATFVKITHSGTYYLKYLSFEIVYLFQVSLDTPIANRELVHTLKKELNESSGFNTIAKRVKKFVAYLQESDKEEFTEYPEYFSNVLTNRRFSDLFKGRTLHEINNQIYKFEKSRSYRSRNK